MQRAFRERGFGAAGVRVDWRAVEERRRAHVGDGRSLRSVVAELATALPSDPSARRAAGRGGGGRGGRGEDAWRTEVDYDKVLDAAAEAYRAGDYDRSKEIYARADKIKRGEIGAENDDDEGDDAADAGADDDGAKVKRVYKNEGLGAMSLDGRAAARHQMELQGVALPGTTDFGGARGKKAKKPG